MKPKKRHHGAVTVGLAFFILYMTYGYISLAYSSNTGAETLYQSKETSLYTLKRIEMMDDSETNMFDCTDTEAFHEYMTNLTMDSFTGSYSFPANERQLAVTYNTPEGILDVVLRDHFIVIIFPYEHSTSRTVSYYYLPDGVDWGYLDTLLRIQ